MLCLCLSDLVPDNPSWRYIAKLFLFLIFIIIAPACFVYFMGLWLNT